MESVVYMTDNLALDTQPEEAVTAETEITETPLETSQANDENPTEQPKLSLAVEDDQQKTSKFDTSTAEYKAFKKANEAKKRKNALIQQMAAEREQLQNKVSQFETELAQIKKGDPPKIEDYIDERDFQEATRKYFSNEKPSLNTDNGQGNTPQQTNQNSSVQSVNLPDHVEFEHFQNEQTMKKSFNDYDNSVQSIKEEIHETIQRSLPNGIPFDDVVNSLLITGNLAKVDMSKALFAASKIPHIKHKLLDPRILSSDILLSQVLKEAENAVKPAKHQDVSTTPAPEIRQGGPIDNHSKAIEAARAKWMETRSASDFQKLKELKKRGN